MCNTWSQQSFQSRGPGKTKRTSRGVELLAVVVAAAAVVIVVVRCTCHPAALVPSWKMWSAPSSPDFTWQNTFEPVIEN